MMRRRAEHNFGMHQTSWRSLVMPSTLAVSRSTMTIRFPTEFRSVWRYVTARIKFSRNALISLSNIHQLQLGYRLYVIDHNGAWPPTLEELISNLDRQSDSGRSYRHLLANPRLPNHEIGYVYLCPNKSMSATEGIEQAVIYEAYEHWPKDGLAVGFLNAPAQIVKEEHDFLRMMSSNQRTVHDS